MTFEPLNPNDVRLFSGRSNPQLAEQMAQHLGIPMDSAKFGKFSNDNLFVQLEASVRGRDVYIVQSLVPPVSDHLLELMMMLDIAKGAAAKEVHAIIPYFSYARSDKKDAPRISITARLVADLLQTAGATRLMTMTLHSPQVHGFFSIPADPLTARGLFMDYLRPRNLSKEDTIVVAPDLGSAKSAARFADGLGLPVAAGNKTRISDSEVRMDEMVGRQIQGFKRAIVHDDEIATGGTMVELCRLLVEYGIEEITLACTHGLFLGNALERLTAVAQVKEIITTDTVPPIQHPLITVLSTASVFSEAILRNYWHESIGGLFHFSDEDQ